MVMWWGYKMGKYHCTALKLPCTATVYASFWETEECCTVCLPILHCTCRGKCHVHAHRSTDILLQTYMWWESISLFLHCVFQSVAEMHGMVHSNVSPLPTVSFEADPITLECLENTNSSQWEQSVIAVAAWVCIDLLLWFQAGCGRNQCQAEFSPFFWVHGWVWQIRLPWSCPSLWADTEHLWQQSCLSSSNLAARLEQLSCLKHPSDLCLMVVRGSQRCVTSKEFTAVISRGTES